MKIFITENGKVLIPDHAVLANESGFDHNPEPITDSRGYPGHGTPGKIIYAWIDGSEYALKLLQSSDIVSADSCQQIFGFSFSNDALVEWETEEVSPF